MDSLPKSHYRRFVHPRFLQAFERHLHHAHRAVNDLASGGDDGFGLLAPQHGLSDFGRIGEMGEPRLSHLYVRDLQPLTVSYS